MKASFLDDCPSKDIEALSKLEVKNQEIEDEKFSFPS
jgi:hypothetical protein